MISENFRAVMSKMTEAAVKSPEVRAAWDAAEDRARERCEAIERMAKAIAVLDYGDELGGGADWDDLQKASREWYLRLATAAYDAL